MHEFGPITREKCPEYPARWHPAADAFPWLDDKAQADLVEDVRANGVLEPIVFKGDYILDGRNRYAAAREALIEYPRVEYLGDDPVGFVVSRNLKRRHMTDSQRAMVAAKLAKLEDGQRQVRHMAEVPTQAEAAQLLNVSERSLQRAKAVQQNGAPELVKAVENGHLPVATAAQIAELPVDRQKEILAAADPKAVLAAAKEIRTERMQVRRAERKETARILTMRNQALPIGERKYACIYADPPWLMKHYSDETGEDRSPEYPRMKTEEICDLPVGDLATDDCTLLLWAIWPMLPDALQVIEAWGFTYKTLGLIWVKINADGTPYIGMGKTGTRANTEPCLLATRGSPLRLNADVSQVIMAPRGIHSQKPAEAYDRIERLVAGPYTELFARDMARPGWDCWGNQAFGMAA